MIVDLNVALNRQALDLLARYNLGFYDALMIAAAIEAGSSTFLSEDMQDGLVIDGKMAIKNPFR